ncbi:MAG: TOBE domain-containing protein [Candidatus Hydrogenedentota bacterium]
MLKKARTSAILVTHDQEEAMTMADRIAVMRAGRIEQTGPPEEIYHHPRTPFVAQFLGATNLLHAAARGKHAQCMLGQLCLNRQAEGRVLVSLRPEQLVMESPRAEGPAGEIMAREFKGHDQTYRVHVGGSEVIIQTHGSCPWRVGDRVALKPLEPAVIVEHPQDAGHAN